MNVPELLNGRRDFHSTTVGSVREFSNLSIHGPGRDSSEFIDFQKDPTPANIHPNGHDPETEGSVSFVFHHSFPMQVWIKRPGMRVEFSYVISVIDFEGSTRFPRSFSGYWDFTKPEPFRIDNYISRRTLLQQPQEFIPNDVLTLQIDVVCHYLETETCQEREEKYINILSDSEWQTIIYGDGKVHLSLDSLLVQRLAEESSYFRRISDTPMREGLTRRMEIWQEELEPFYAIEKLIMLRPPVSSYFEFHSLKDIFQVYVVADKYDIPTVVGTCRCWLRLCLSRDNVEEVSDLANRYDDEDLQEAIRVFLESGHEGNEVDQGSWVSGSTAANVKYFFKKEPTSPHSSDLCFIRTDAKNENSENSFDFYS